MSTATKTTPTALPPEALPLGPDSLTWKLFGDRRGLMLVGRTGVLQVMHPTISQALVDHSDYFDNPLNRILRSAPPILGVVYDEQHGDTAAWVRDRHKSIKGEHPGGQKYRALDPDAYWWAHSTFFEAQIARCEILGEKLTYAQKEQLFGETLTWYARYGLTMKDVPHTYAEFEAYWEHMHDHVLAATPVAVDAMRRGIPPAPFPEMAGPLWTAVAPFVGYLGPTVIAGTLPPKAQTILGVKTSPLENVALSVWRTTVRSTWRFAPPQVRRPPQVRDADRREGWRG